MAGLVIPASDVRKGNKSALRQQGDDRTGVEILQQKTLKDNKISMLDAMLLEFHVF